MSMFISDHYPRTVDLARFFVNDARFADRENGRTDFRFYIGGDNLLISFVEVRRVKK